MVVNLVTVDLPQYLAQDQPRELNFILLIKALLLLLLKVTKILQIDSMTTFKQLLTTLLMTIN